MSGSAWGFVWLMFIIKIPLVSLLYLVWWAIREEPEAAIDPGDGEGGQRRDRGPRIRPPQPPRRGPHGDPMPRPPERVRSTRREPHVPAGHR
jgi:hypothetical protein